MTMVIPGAREFKCINSDCQMQTECYRYTKKFKKGRYVTMMFEPESYKLGAHCDYFAMIPETKTLPPRA